MVHVCCSSVMVPDGSGSVHQREVSCRRPWSGRGRRPSRSSSLLRVRAIDADVADADRALRARARRRRIGARQARRQHRPGAATVGRLVHRAAGQRVVERIADPEIERVGVVGIELERADGEAADGVGDRRPRRLRRREVVGLPHAAPSGGDVDDILVTRVDANGRGAARVDAVVDRAVLLDARVGGAEVHPALAGDGGVRLHAGPRRAHQRSPPRRLLGRRLEQLLRDVRRRHVAVVGEGVDAANRRVVLVGVVARLALGQDERRRAVVMLRAVVRVEHLLVPLRSFPPFPGARERSRTHRHQCHQREHHCGAA